MASEFGATRTLTVAIRDIAPMPPPPEHFVDYPRLDRPRKALRRILTLSERWQRPWCMALVGDAGVGKSTFVYKIMAEFRRGDADDLTEIPVVYVEFQSPMTRKGAARALLEALGDPGPFERLDYAEITGRAIVLMRACKVKLVILDDIHHIIKHNEVDWELSEWLKSLVKKSSVPFLIIGLPGLVERLLKSNRQLSRWFRIRETIAPFAWWPAVETGDTARDTREQKRFLKEAAEFGQFVTFVEKMVERPLTRQGSRLTLLAKLHFATGGVAGNIIELLQFASLAAEERNGNVIAHQDLWEGFEAWLDDHLQAREHMYANADNTPRPDNPFNPPAQESPAPESGTGASLDPPEGVNKRSHRREGAAVG